MAVRRLLAIFLAFCGGVISATRATSAMQVPNWESDGPRSCIFDGMARKTACVQYHRTIEHRTKNGNVWREYRWMWRGSNGFEVLYNPRIGLLGISSFTIGVLFDRKSDLTDHASDRAVSYSASREELVIGVPAEGYEFRVSGGSVG